MWIKLQKFICLRFRRFLLLLGSLAVILLAVFLPLSASADTIHIKAGLGALSSNALITRYSDGYPVDRLEQQYFYGGDYNPLILADSKSAGYSWTEFDASVYVSFNRTVPAGTTLRISCGGWFQKAYTMSATYSPHMYASPYNIADVSNGSYENYLGSRVLLGIGSGDPIQTSNGVYRGYLFSGTFTTPFPMSGIYLCFSGELSTARTSSAYFGISCSDISFDGNLLVDGSYPGFDGETSAFTDYEQQESALMEDIDIPGALDNLNEHKAQSDSLMRQLLGSFQAISALFLKMSVKLPEFYILASVSFSIGIFCALVGIAQGIYRSHIRSVREKRRTLNAQAREAAKFNIRVTKTKTVGDPETGVRTTFSRRVK